MSDQVVFGGSSGGSAPKRSIDRRTAFIAGITALVVVVVAVIGVGTFLVVRFLTEGLGPQPAEVLPSTTFAYASLDTDPKDGERLDLIKLGLKFPGITRHLSLSSSGSGTDLRQKIVESLLKEDDTCDLTWDADFKPWMGKKFAVAGVEIDGAPVPAVVVQVTDGSAAQAVFAKFQACDTDTQKAAFRIDGDWAVISSSQSALDKIAAATASGTLAASSDFKSRLAETGADGFLRVYAAPQTGQILASDLDKYLSELTSLTTESDSASGFVSGGSTAVGRTVTPAPDDFLSGFCPGIAASGQLGDQAGAPANGQLESELKSFGGFALTGRVHAGGLEIESSFTPGTAPTGSSQAGQAVAKLPADTTAVFATSVADGAWEKELATFGKVCGSGFDADSVNQELSSLTGLDFPQDADALLGKAIVLSLGQVTPEALDGLDAATDDASTQTALAQLPFALSVTGDPTAIQAALGRLTQGIQAETGTSIDSYLAHDATGDTVVVGPDASYRQHATAGGLESDKTFTDVVPHAAQADRIVYVDLDALDGVIEHEISQQGGNPAGYSDWVQPLKAFGMSSWVDGATVHAFARLSTD